MAVLGSVAFAGDVDLVGLAVGSLFDAMFEVGIVDEPGHPSAKDFKVGVVRTI